MFALIALAWVLIGGYSVLTIFASRQSNTSTAWIISILMFANAGVLIWVGRRLANRSGKSYLLALLVLGVNILLTVTDQFGIIDAATLAIDVALFLLLISTRSRYFGR
jgi:hypothetical protein